MHQKKRKLFVLYSIPIWFRRKFNSFSKSNLCNKEKLYLVSYSIPLSCMVVLLLTGIFAINPSFSLKTNAIEVGEELNQELSEEKDEVAAEELVETSADNAGLMSQEATASSTTFEIGGAGQNEVVETGVNEVAYRSHIVNVSINNAEDYYLMISGQPTLAMSGGTASLEGITGNNVTGTNIPAGQWGYGWDYTGTKTNDEMVYAALPSADTKITIPALINNAVSFKGKLNFAAKFPDNATLGSYTSNVVLTLIVTPKANTGGVTWRDANGDPTTYEAGTNTMQGIDEVNHGADGGFCKNNNKISEGWTVDLLDNRGTKPVTYTVVKLGDGNCWMGQGLALESDSTTPLRLTADDTDIDASMGGYTNGWDLPISNNSSNWNAVATTAQVRTGSLLQDNAWKRGIGNYYSWCAATAGTCMENGVVITSPSTSNFKQAASSICPRNWKLPIGGTNNASTDYSFYKLTSTYAGYQSNQTINGITGQRGFLLGYSGGHVYNSANFWPATGSTYQQGITNGGDGHYWSRTAATSSNSAYNLYLDAYDGRLYVTGNNASAQFYLGYAIRCVAEY